jgi:hypothetical protein
VRAMAGSSTIAEQVRARMQAFTATERKAAHVLLATYPLAGLEPVAEFAGRAGVSAPTILRFIGRLGIASYPDFQKRLREELEAQLKPPLKKSGYRPGPEHDERNGLSRFRTALGDNLDQTFAHLPPGEFDAVVDLLADGRAVTASPLEEESGDVALPMSGFSEHVRVYRAKLPSSHRPGRASLCGILIPLPEHDVELQQRSGGICRTNREQGGSRGRRDARYAHD